MNGPQGPQGHHQQAQPVQQNGQLMDPHHPAAHPGPQGASSAFYYISSCL